MAIQERAQGQYVQPGTIVLFPEVSEGTIISVDGYLALDTVYLQADYPVLFSIIGTSFNDPGKGDNPSTQFRTPTDAPPAAGGYQWRIRF